ncbi:hypothetical protein F7230_06010 [Corynebacterium sp. 320]|nr:hypothetical protein F7230_06010 [Corynebacterium sp. 320]KAB1550699.1 hypothetical protein F7233_09185 [Corynebacterium sp. 321]KAB1551058.1 hypothetical protein F7232_08355 [Corynebacterium sp. 319]KAB3526887.1 hypothetical protein F8354_06010 [Corynebacterium sp. 250]KAB3538380.1 hypothetical protein F8390_08910 [Corynebacterium sp. 366]QNP93127.1 hypothetical protein IAU67_01305 [Corynebacterium zhongnanshanii]
MMNSAPIIILAHGSRHPQADDVIDTLACAVAEQGDREVRAAHLDFSQDTLTSVAADLAEAGHTRAVVVPLLFTRAFHMRHDVPQALEGAQTATGLDLVLADGLGTEDDVAEVVARFAMASATRANGGNAPHVGRLALYSVGSSVRGANDTVADFTTVVGRKLSGMCARAGGSRTPVQARSFVATGPQAIEHEFHSFIDEHTIVQPLFVAPGTLWDKQRCRMPQRGWHSSHLGVALAPLVLTRADAATMPS